VATEIEGVKHRVMMTLAYDLSTREAVSSRNAQLKEKRNKSNGNQQSGVAAATMRNDRLYDA